MFVERHYQRAALNGVPGSYPGIYGALREHRSTLLELPTGCGKTIVFARVVDACVRKGSRALILAHRRELIEQARDKLLASTSIDRWQVGIEMGADQARASQMVVCASVQTLQRKRLAQFPADYFRLIVVDEAHHAVAPTYKAILSHFAGAKVLGVTATPKPLIGSKVFESIAYRYSLLDAIRDQHLVPILPGKLIAAPEIDLSQVRTVAGDFSHEQLAQVMERGASVAIVAKAALEQSEGRPTIAFCVSVEQARKVAEAINAARPGCAAALDGTSSRAERKSVLASYAAGRIQFLVNCALFTEGFDAPRTSCIIIARPTKSHVLFAQMIGRATRLLGPTWEASVAAGKIDMLVLDFACATGRHELVQCLDLLVEDADILARAKKRMRVAAGGNLDLDLVLSEVRDEIEHERAEQLRLEVEKAKYQAREIAILRELPESTMTAEQAPKFWHLDALARKNYKGAADQLKWHRRGVYRGPWTRESAAALVSEMGKRQRRGLCSPKQANILRQQGLDPDVPVDVASAAIDAIIQNNWRKPSDLLVRIPQLRLLEASV